MSFTLLFPKAALRCYDSGVFFVDTSEHKNHQHNVNGVSLKYLWIVKSAGLGKILCNVCNSPTVLFALFHNSFNLRQMIVNRSCYEHYYGELSND